jgi:hypothetical protein
VAYDTPDNLKAQFTHMFVRIKTGNPEALTEYLDAQSIRYEHENGHMKAFLKDARQSLQISPWHCVGGSRSRSTTATLVMWFPLGLAPA